MTLGLNKRFSSFTYFNVTQFLGALNDNVYKLLIVFFLINLEGIQHSDTIIATTGALFVLPFLLFSAGSGTLADRLSKRNIIVLCKIFELLIMALGIAAFAFKTKIGAYVILFLMATHSAILAPSKYGIVPELVKTDRISQANGLLTSLTYFAIILGTFLASFVTHITNRNFIIGGLFCTAIAFTGMLTSFCIEYTPPAGSRKKINPLFLYEIYKTLKEAKKENTLLIAVFGSSYFLFAGAFIQLNIIPFAVDSLHLSDVQGGYLFLLTAVGIGIGAFIAAKVSGMRIELGLVPIGGIMMGICCFLLDAFSEHLLLIIPLIVITGIFGGIYLVPLDSFIQMASPAKERGQVVAASNFLGFCGVLAASALIFINKLLGFQADKGFTVLGFLIIAMIIGMIISLRDYFLRFLGMLLSRVCFEMTVVGQRHIPLTSPALIICFHHLRQDSLILMGVQSNRLHFFIEGKRGAPFLHRLLRKFLAITPCRSLKPPNVSKATISEIKAALHKGQSVCIFLEDDYPNNPPLQKLAADYEKLLDNPSIPVVTVEIDKNPQKANGNSFISKSLRFLRVPTVVTFDTPNH